MAVSALFELHTLSIYQLCQWAAWLVALFLVYNVSRLYLKRRELVANYRPFPGPQTHWLYGNAHMFNQDGTDLDKMNRFAEQYPYGFTMWMGNFLPALLICHPDYAKAILSRQDPKHKMLYDFVVPWIVKHFPWSWAAALPCKTLEAIYTRAWIGSKKCNGLLVLSGPKWHQHRKLLTPGFHYDVLKPYVKLTSDCTNIMLNKWERLGPGKTSVELFHHVSLMTLDTIMKCAFGYQSNCQSDSENEYIKAVYELSYLTEQRIRFFPHHSDLVYYFSSSGSRYRKAQKVTHRHTDKVIKLRKESLKQESELEKIKKKRHLDFLDILLFAKDENGQGLSDEDMRAEVDTFMFEGHDTTASGISWTLYCMAKYPEHQKKCREEIREVLGGRDTVEWEDLGKLTYTTLCIKESMRLYPPVPEIARQLAKPITFCDGRSLPKGAIIVLNMYIIGRCPSVWEDPEVFDPMRFSPENASTRHSHGFLPFSAGSRNCIGQNFAMNELKVAIALTLQKFEMSTIPDKEPLKLQQLVLRSVNGIHINLKKV